MATRRKTAEPDEGVRLLPVTAKGEIVNDGRSWQMPAGEGPPVDAYDDDEPIVENATDRVMALLGDVAGDDKAIVKVYRKRADGKNAWLDEYSPAAFEAGGMTMMRAKYGVGSYVIFLYGMTPRGAFGIRTKAEVEIEASRDFVQPGAQPVAPAADARMDRLEAALLKMAERPAVDPMAEMQKMMAMVGTMREAFGLNQPAAKKSDVAETLAVMREIREAASELTSGRNDDGDEGGLLGMAKSIIPLVGQVMAQATPPAPALPALPPIDTGSPIASDNQPAPEGASAGEQPMSAEMLAALALKGYLKAVVMMAKSGVDPQKGADMIYKSLPDEMIGLMELPVWWELLIEQAPDLKPYQEWITKARDLAMAKFQQEADAPPEAT